MRVVGCHAHCPDYAEAKKQHDAEQKWLREHSEASRDAAYQMKVDASVWLDVTKNRNSGRRKS